MRKNLLSLSLVKPRDNVEVVFKMYMLFIFGGLRCQFILFRFVINSYTQPTVVKVLCYKSEGRWFDPRWCHWNFSLT